MSATPTGPVPARHAPAPFPATLDAITPDWLTSVLARAEISAGARVVGFEPESVGAGAGFVARVARLRLFYDQECPQAPASLIVKLASDHPGARLQARAFGHYRKEVGFYRDLAGLNPIASPHLFFQALDPEGFIFNLLLEDFPCARSGDQLTGISADEAALAAETAALMHGRWWEAPRLRDLAWLPTLDHASLLGLGPVFRDGWDRYLAFSGDEIAAAVGGLGGRLRVGAAALLRALAKRPRTLVHGDYRADNLLFDSAASPPIVVDWQLVHFGLGIHDLAYLLVGSLEVEERRRVQADLLSLYLRALRAGGVEGYDEATALGDYRLSIALGWMWTVVGIATLDLSHARAAKVFEAWNRRLAAAIADLEVDRAVRDALA